MARACRRTQLVLRGTGHRLQGHTMSVPRKPLRLLRYPRSQPRPPSARVLDQNQNGDCVLMTNQKYDLSAIEECRLKKEAFGR